MKPQRMLHRSPLAIAIAAALGASAGMAAPVLAAEEPADAIGPRYAIFQVTDEQEYDVEGVVVAQDADGDAVVAWRAYREDPGSGYEIAGIYARRVSAAGEPGSVLTLFEVTEGVEEYDFPDLAIAVDPDGDAVVAWAQYGRFAAETAVRARTIATNDTVGIVIEVADESPDYIKSLSVGMDASGGFALAWYDEYVAEVRYKRYSAAGAPIDSGTPASDFFNVEAVHVGVGPAGDFVVAWTDVAYDAAFARPYGSDGGPLGVAPVTVSETAPEDWWEDMRVAVDPDGNFAVGWDALNADAYDYFGEMRARRFMADGTPLSGEVQLVRSVVGPVRINSLVIDPDGDLLATWRGVDYEDYDFLGGLVTVTGGDEPVIYTIEHDMGDCAIPEGECNWPDDIVMDADGDMMMAVTEYGYGYQPTGVSVQRFRGPAEIDLAAELTIEPAEASSGDSVTLTFTIENLQPISAYYGVAALDAAAGAARGVHVNINVPESLELDITADGWTCLSTAGVLSCTTDEPLAASDAFMFETVLELPAALTGKFDISVEVGGDHLDPDAGNNTAEASVTVTAPDDGQPPADDDDDATPPPSGGSGGGGGAFGWLALLGLLPLLRRR